MNIIRPIRLSDLDDLLHIANAAGAGFTSLPPVPQFLRKKIELSEHSFNAEVIRPGHERYMFVLEDTATGRVGGCCAVEAACGLDEPFYNYHVGTTVHASHEMKVYSHVPTLYLSNDYTGVAVMCSLFLMPEFRDGGNGRLLSKARFLFMANFAQRFAERVIAEMRGVSDDKGRSPFWEGLGRHFFAIDYDRAEHIVGMGNKAFIAELMPKHPIYAVLLSPEAREVMGQVHSQTAPALKLLEREGFRYQNYIDIFDGGPAVEAPLNAIRSIRLSRVLTTKIGPASAAAGASSHLVSNIELHDYRCGMVDLSPDEDSVTLTPECATALRVGNGDPVRVVSS